MLINYLKIKTVKSNVRTQIMFLLLSLIIDELIHSNI